MYKTTHVRTPAQIIMAGLRLYRDFFTTVILPVVIAAILMGGMEYLSALARSQSQAVDIQNISSVTSSPLEATIIIYGLLQFLLLPYFSAVVLHRANNMYQGTIATNKNSWKIARDCYLELLLATLITLLFVGLSMALYLIPAFFFAVMLMFYLPYIVLEKVGMWRSILASCRLVWGNWWRTAWVLLQAFLLPIVITVLMYALMSNAPVIVQFIVTTMVELVMLPYFFAVIIIQFKDLQLRQQLKAAVTT